MENGWDYIVNVPTFNEDNELIQGKDFNAFLGYLIVMESGGEMQLIGFIMAFKVFPLGL